MNNSLIEMRRNIMKEAHAMCREMRSKGFEFNYHVQLGLNIKYLWEAVGKTVDTMMEEETPVNTTVEETVMENTEEEIEDAEEYDEEEEYEKYENYVEYVVENTEEEETKNAEEIVENTEDNSEYKLGSEFEEHECTEAFCGSCLMDTLQYREGGEVVCTECGEKWELIPYEEYKVLNKYAQFTEDEEDDDQNFMEGYQLDVETFVHNEIIGNWPAKILCKEDCRGICPVCGQNLNERDCGCDTFVPDPRMAVIQDIFNANKEV